MKSALRFLECTWNADEFDFADEPIEVRDRRSPLVEPPYLTPQQLESWITSTPSRVDDASSVLADGKVAYVRSIAPAASMNAGATLEL
jgi:hypothetical protein